VQVLRHPAHRRDRMIDPGARFAGHSSELVRTPEKI
jgi:hypothetical protein